MLTSYQCPNCKKLFSEQDYNIHSTYCKNPTSQYTNQIYGAKVNLNANNILNYLNNYNLNSIPSQTVYTSKTNTNPTSKINTYNSPKLITNPTQTINTYTTSPKIITNPSSNITTYPNSNMTTIPTTTINIPSTTINIPTTTINTNPNTNIILPQQNYQRAQTQKQYFRPQTITYFNSPNQGYDYSQLYPNQNIATNQNNISVNSTYKCTTCGKEIPLKEQKDHLLSHKLEQEEKDRIQAQSLQDEDMFENLPPEKIEEQRKIEDFIRRQQRQGQNNNQPNNNIMSNDFNINDDMNFGNLGNFGGITRINNNGIPNVIIRRTNTTNNNSNGMNNLGEGMGMPNFFENFFNGNMNMNMDNDFFNNPSTGNFRRIIIPMGGMGNFGGMGNQNDLNELIERMLHYRRDNPTDAAIVSELPETKIDDINKLEEDKKNCVICMEDFKNGDKSTNLPCLHMFHTNCIQSWLKTQNTCPICKFKLTQDNINNINSRTA